MSPVKTIGFVIFLRTRRGLQYLLLHHRGQYWNFPKGRQEPTDARDELATAYRELREETGLPKSAVRLVRGFRRTYHYRFVGRTAAGKREQVSKLAIFYLGELREAHPITVSHEHLGYGWFDFPAAWRRLCYGGGRRVLQAAAAFLDSHRSPAKVKAGPRL